MGVSRTDLFSAEQNAVAAFGRVLAHPARVAILEYLVRSNTCINGDLVAELGLAQATISQHLRELKEIGLIKGTIDGTSVCYCIDADRWTEMQDTFQRMFTAYVKAASDRCC